MNTLVSPGSDFMRAASLWVGGAESPASCPSLGKAPPSPQLDRSSEII